MAGVAALVRKHIEISNKISLILEPPSRNRPYMIASAYFDKIRKDERLWK